jgi:protein-S-isoprenylcysteine O-methyltransferase Ste14
MIWACPAVTTDRLMFNLLWSLWIVMGAQFEERDLISRFGGDYRRYQQCVPMLIPYRRPCQAKTPCRTCPERPPIA